MSGLSTSRASAEELDLYGALVERLLFPVWEGGIQRRATLRYRALLSRSQRWSLDEQRQLQQGKLQRLLRHAYAHVDHYRRSFRAAGFEPDDLRDLDDLVRLPILTRDEAQRTVEARTSAAPPFVAWRALTGGTLGSSLAFGYDGDTESWRKAGQLRAWGWAGHRVGARTLYYVGVNHGLHAPPGQRLKTHLERTLKRERYLSCMVRDGSAIRRPVPTWRATCASAGCGSGRTSRSCAMARSSSRAIATSCRRPSARRSSKPTHAVRYS